MNKPSKSATNSHRRRKLSMSIFKNISKLFSTTAFNQLNLSETGQWLVVFYRDCVPLFSLFIMLALLIISLPALGKRKGSAFFYLAVLFQGVRIWIIQYLDLTIPFPAIAELMLALTVLILFYSFFSLNFQNGWTAGIGIPLILTTSALGFMQSLPYFYNLMHFSYMRRLMDALQLPWLNLIAGVFLSALMIRLITALIRNESLRAWSLIILASGLAVGLIHVLRLGGKSEQVGSLFLQDSMGLMLLLSLSSFIGPVQKERKEKLEPQAERLYRELNRKKTELEQLEKELESEDNMMGRIIQKSHKLREALLPSLIHPDDFWEASVYYQPENSDHPDYYDFIYNYGRKLHGAVFFDIQNGMNGSFTGSWIKGILPTEFNESPSLSALYRRLNQGTEIFREGRELNCQMLRFNSRELEYSGWNNAPILMKSGKRKKAAVLIQDKTHNWENMKSYRMQIEPGDAIVMTNAPFYDIPHSVTEEPFGVERSTEILGGLQGKASELVQGLMRERMRYYGDRRMNKGVFILALRRKTLRS